MGEKGVVAEGWGWPVQLQACAATKRVRCGSYLS